jgi:hypothetical protein
MQSLNAPVAREQLSGRRQAAAVRRSVSGPPGEGPPPPPRLRPVAVLAARVARRLDAEAARGVLRA